MADLRTKIDKQYGKKNSYQKFNSISAMFGNDYEAAAAFLNANPEDLRKGKVPQELSSKPKEALEKLHATPAGQREKAEAELAVSAGKLLDSSSMLGKAADAQIEYAMRLRRDAVAPLTRLVEAQAEMQNQQLKRLHAIEFVCHGCLLLLPDKDIEPLA